MTYDEAMNNILDHIDAIENVEESINFFKNAILNAANNNDNRTLESEDWKAKYEDMAARYKSLDGQYRERFFANDMNTVNSEDVAATQREEDYAREEREKQISTNIKLEDLLDN